MACKEQAKEENPKQGSVTTKRRRTGKTTSRIPRQKLFKEVSQMWERDVEAGLCKFYLNR